MNIFCPLFEKSSGHYIRWQEDPRIINNADRNIFAACCTGSTSEPARMVQAGVASKAEQYYCSRLQNNLFKRKHTAFMKRRLVIGDIHGGLRALLQILDRAAVTAGDMLIFLGDYVDGWSESPGVIDYLIELSARQQCVILKGNHDEWCEVWSRTGDADPAWLYHGGQSTVNSYAAIAPDKRRKHLHFFEQMKLYYIDESNRLFVHAGFTSMHGPQHELHPSSFTWDRALWETARSMKDTPRRSLLYPKRLKLFDEISIGHTPTLYYDVDVPMQGGNVWNIDTGAAFKGRLTIMDIASKEYWQSDLLPALYPGEKERNRD